jgi:hypothetical protein
MRLLPLLVLAALSIAGLICVIGGSIAAFNEKGDWDRTDTKCLILSYILTVLFVSAFVQAL